MRQTSFLRMWEVISLFSLLSRVEWWYIFSHFLQINWEKSLAIQTSSCQSRHTLVARFALLHWDDLWFLTRSTVFLSQRVWFNHHDSKSSVVFDVQITCASLIVNNRLSNEESISSLFTSDFLSDARDILLIYRESQLSLWELELDVVESAWELDWAWEESTTNVDMMNRVRIFDCKQSLIWFLMRSTMKRRITLIIYVFHDDRHIVLMRITDISLSIWH